MDTMQTARPMTANGTNRVRIGAAVTTGLFTLMMTIAGVLYLIGPPPIVAAIRNLGYPDYLRQLPGFAKLLGAAALIAPGLRMLREWAYAGFTFDLVGAIASHTLSEPTAQAAPALFALALLVVPIRCAAASKRPVDSDRPARPFPGEYLRAVEVVVREMIPGRTSFLLFLSRSSRTRPPSATGAARRVGRGHNLDRAGPSRFEPVSGPGARRCRCSEIP